MCLCFKEGQQLKQINKKPRVGYKSPQSRPPSHAPLDTQPFRLLDPVEDLPVPLGLTACCLASSLRHIWRRFQPDCCFQVSLRISADHVASIMRSCLSREIPLMPSFCEAGIYRGSFPGAALRGPAKASLSPHRPHCPRRSPRAATGRSSSQHGHYHPAPLVQACSGTPHSKPFV